jgi:hypothetical protein
MREFFFTFVIFFCLFSIWFFLLLFVTENDFFVEGLGYEPLLRRLILCQLVLMHVMRIVYLSILLPSNIDL